MANGLLRCSLALVDHHLEASILLPEEGVLTTVTREWEISKEYHNPAKMICYIPGETEKSSHT